MTSACRVVAIGEILWDVFDDSRKLGGAPLNFAAHVARLGNPVLVVSGIGDDQLGHAALAEIKAVGIDTRFIQIVKAFSTGTARVWQGPNGQNSFRIERPAAYDAVNLTEADLREIAAWSPSWLYHGTLCPYERQSRATLDALAAALPEVPRFYDLNLRTGHYSAELVRELMALADVVKLNDSEMAEVAEFAGLPKTGTADFCAEGAARFGWDAVAVTLGENGCAVWRGGEYAEAPGRKVQVADTVGAGDAFGAAMIHGLSCGWSARAIADVANQLGSLIASRPGGIPDWSIDELQIPAQPFGTVAPAGDAAPSVVTIPPPGARVP